MTAEILSIGDELLIGQVVNTNASWMAEQLSSAGITVGRITVVGDQRDAMERALRTSLDTHDIVLLTGGLGPTHDDVTRDVVTRFFDDTLQLSHEVLSDIEAFFAQRKRTLREIHRDQAMIPSTALVIRNAHGTAPGMHFRREGKQVFVLPGVPFEMRPMMERYVLPALAGERHPGHLSHTVLTTGIPESDLAERLSGIETLHEQVSIAYLPSPLGVRVRVSARARNASEAEDAVQRVLTYIQGRAGDFIFGSGTVTLEETVGRLLREREVTISAAESCTGGRITDRLTDVPGSSAYVLCGVVAYSNTCKTDLLNVPPALLAKHGAVSREVAEAMAAGVRWKTGADIGISTTGIAGPGGATDSKPVGLVWIGLSSATVSGAWKFHFGEHRDRTKTRATQMALDIVRRQLLHLPIPPSQS